MVGQAASHGGVDVGMDWIILAGRWADGWTSGESEFDQICWCSGEVDLESSMNLVFSDEDPCLW